jgi:hypothetical protein
MFVPQLSRCIHALISRLLNTNADMPQHPTQICG